VVDDFLVLRCHLFPLALVWGVFFPNSNFLFYPWTFHHCRSLYKWTSVDIRNDTIAISLATYTYSFHSFLIFN
jgi:hypothetical protein